jgi:flagellar biosynthesis anti-sigma factor FlgM
MRIESNYDPQVPEAKAGNTSNAPAAENSTGSVAGTTASAGFGEDQAEISGAHLQVQALAAQALQLPEVRQERVTALRQAVESGHYDATPEQIAGGLLGEMVAARAA